MPRPAFILILCLALLTGRAVSLRAEPPENPWTLVADKLDSDDDERAKLARIKAGFIINFASFTEWPSGTFRSGEMPLVITVAGDREIAQYVATLTTDKTIKGRSVAVYHMAAPPDDRDEDALEAYVRGLRRSHVVFFSDVMTEAQVRQMLLALGTRPVLTIGDGPRFAEAGGMLGLVTRDRRLAFDANVEAIDDAKLQVSSKVLRLARIVRSR